MDCAHQAFDKGRRYGASTTVIANISAIILLLTLAVTFSLLIGEKWRYDIVALGTLLFLTVIGIVLIDEVSVGFSNPAVVTVVAVLVISKGLQNSGLLDYLARGLARDGYSVASMPNLFDSLCS